MAERTEGWGNLGAQTASAHYFREGRSLCGRWMAFGAPRWESDQKRGPEPKRGAGTCKACWRKAPDEAPAVA